MGWSTTNDTYGTDGGRGRFGVSTPFQGLRLAEAIRNPGLAWVAPSGLEKMSKLRGGFSR